MMARLPRERRMRWHKKSKPLSHQDKGLDSGGESFVPAGTLLGRSLRERQRKLEKN